MTYREDKYESGDLVTWSNTPTGKSRRSTYGIGPFQILRVTEVSPSDYNLQGHTQIVTARVGGGDHVFVGTEFAPIEGRTKTSTNVVDLERLLDALGMSKHARPISPADVFEMALAEVRALKERDAAVNEPLRQAAIKMQVAVGNVLLSGGLDIDKWFDPLVKCQQELAAQTKGTRQEYESYFAEVGRHEVMERL